MARGIKKLVLTEINSTASWVEFARICEEMKDQHFLEFALGVEFRNEDNLVYIALAKNNKGFEEINQFLSQHQCHNLQFPDVAPEFENVFIVYPFSSVPQAILKNNEYIGIRSSELNKLYFSPLRALIQRFVILQPVTFKDKKGYNLHRLLRSIDTNTLLSKLSPASCGNECDQMVREEELLQRFKDFPQIIENTQLLLTECYFDFKLRESKNKKTFSNSLHFDREKLRTLTSEGLIRRYGGVNKEAQARAETELEIIAGQSFESYFLISHDIVSYAKTKGFPHVGRGSGANSMVSFVLGLTDVDPIELDLYFERFLNPQRSSPPDFDIDFSWLHRDEIISYILEKYNTSPEAPRAALLASFATFQGRAILRELGKVFGLPKEEIDDIVHHPDKNRGRDHITKLIFDYGKMLIDFPKNLSVHAGGILISEDSLYKYTALNLPPKNFKTVHLDMYSAEELGYYKYDILSQRGLGHIKDSVELIKENQGIEVDINRFTDFKADNRINESLREGDAIGCFYVESPAMRGLLSKVKCDNYRTLVAVSSIIRPGVASSGMMREYIYRHHNPGKFTYIHPKMEELMEETYGVMVYQEDVIKVAHHFAGLTLADADVLRRGMSGKYRHRSEFQKVEKDFFKNCRERGYSDEISKEVWRQIESFSGYSFSKAHSASYAVESYQSLYLKTYFPLEFYVGVINNFGGFYKTEFYFHEVRRAGAELEAPCVNRSNYLTSISGKKVFVGFIHLKNLDKKVAENIQNERSRNGFYVDLYDFIRRTLVGIEQLAILIRIGAFRFTGKSKRVLLWEAFGYLGKGKPKEVNAELFSIPSKNFNIPQLDTKPFEDPFDEMELLEFPLRNPFELLDKSYQPDIEAAELKNYSGKDIQILGYLVATKDTRTKQGILMHFGTFMDHKGAHFDTVNFPEVSKRFPFLGKGFYLIQGRVVFDFNYPIVEATSMKKIPMVNFHNN